MNLLFFFSLFPFYYDFNTFLFISFTKITPTAAATTIQDAPQHLTF